MDEISTISANKQNVQAGLSKSIILDPEQFNRNRMKFEDWQRGITLPLKSIKVMEMNNRIIAILAHLRGGITGIYAQKKLNKLDKETETQDWDKFL